MPVSKRPPSAPRRPSPPSQPRATTWKTWVKRAVAGLLVLLLALVLLTWGVLQWGILPRVNQWRPQIEARLGQALGTKVHIAAIDVGSGYWRRTLSLRQVVLKDARGEEALRLERVEVVMSPASLMPRSLTAWIPRFHVVLIDQPKLEARRAADGSLFVAGLPLGSRKGPVEGDTRAADWLFSQGRFVIRNGAVSWADEQRQAPVLQLTAVDIELRNTLNHHDLRIDATPPPAWGARFSLQGEFKAPLLAGGVLARPGDWQRWRGTLQLALPHSDLRELQRHVTLPFELQEGRGSLNVKAAVDAARIDSLSADLALQDLQVKFAGQAEPLQLRELAAQMQARRSRAAGDSGGDERVELNAHGLRFTTGDGVAWPAADLYLALQQDGSGAVTGGEAQAQRLDVAVLAQLAGRLPLPASLRRWVEESRPQGVIQPLRLAWSGPVEQPQRYTASGQATGLSLLGKAAAPPPAPAGSAPAAAGLPAPHATPGRPGLRNAAVEFSASETGGQAHVSMERGALELPGVFEDPQVALDSLDAQLHWRIVPAAPGSRARPAVEVQLREIRLANADLQGSLKGWWRTGPGEGLQRGGYLPGQLELDVQLSRAQAARVARYLPLGLPETARRYVTGAVRAGQLRDVVARVSGDLWDFPYAGRSDGEFRVRGLLEDGVLAYVPATAEQPSPWPAFNQLRGELVFERQGMQIRNAQARLGGVGSGQFLLSGVNGGIKDFAHEPLLVLEGQGRGRLSDALQYVQATPLGDWTSHALARAQAQGDATLQLALRLPLNDLSTAGVRGHVQLAGNELRLVPQAPLLSNVRGRVEFTERSFVLRGAALRTLGGDATLEGGMQDDGSVRFTGEGKATAEGLRAAGELGPVAQLAGQTSGSAAYKLNLAFVRGQPELLVTSNLAGLASTLPAPFAKPAEQPWPLRVELRPLANAREQWRVELGTLLQVQLQRDVAGTAARLLRGGIGVGEPAPTPDQGLEVAVNLPSTSLDAWRAWADQAAGKAADPSTAAAGAADSQATLPERISLRVRDLQAFGRKLSNVNAVATRVPRERDGTLPWRVQVEADQVSGRIEYRGAPAGTPAGAAAGEGRIFARLSRLSLPQSDASAVESLLDQTTSVPALDVVVEDFELRGKKLGRLEIEAVNRGDSGAAREWQLAKFNLTTPEAQLSATGNWTAVNVIADPATRISARRRTAMSYQLNLSDAGATLTRLGLGGTLRGGKGRMTGDIAWFGSPLSPDIPSLSGSLNIGLDAGQFLKADPGAARLLGVLSLQALPRRLLLDFRDVFQEGFSFDNLSGDVTIAQGSASTRNLRIRSVQAVVLMEGSADIGRETQDLRVWVVPEINAGTASLAYAIINPAVGLGTFIGQMFLRKPLIEANTREFRITGPWADPKVDRVERKAAQPAPGATSGGPPGEPVRQ